MQSKKIYSNNAIQEYKLWNTKNMHKRKSTVKEIQVLKMQSKNSNNTVRKALSHINTVDQKNFMLIKVL